MASHVDGFALFFLREPEAELIWRMRSREQMASPVDGFALLLPEPEAELIWRMRSREQIWPHL